MPQDMIVIKGARENNLKNISLSIPRNQFVVFTGLSGSGKSSLAFDTIYAEGQRRYVESLSSYARQFLGQMEKPDVDIIEGLSPAISIDQKTTSHNPRSTVGTVTEIYDYMRLLYARVGTPHCPHCGRPIKRQSVDQITDQIMALPERTKLQMLAPVVRKRKGEHTKVLEDAKKSGYSRARIDGIIYELDDLPQLDKNKKHTIDIVIDRLIMKDGIQKRLSESIETACQLSGGLLSVDLGDHDDLTFSQNFSCPDCGFSMEEVEPRLFSFNNPAGACPRCAGLGVQMVFDPDLVIPNPNLSISEGAISANGWNSAGTETSTTFAMLSALAKSRNFSLDTPFKDLSEEAKKIILYGDKGNKLNIPYTVNGVTRNYEYEFEGVIESINRRYRDTSSDYMKQEYESLMSSVTCPVCKGKRLKPEVLAVTIGGISITDLAELTIRKAGVFLEQAEFSETGRLIADQILREIRARLGFLMDVGLDYLTLARSAGTLSGGEAQRIRLATQIGSGLVGVVYILDEPSIGLHQRDNHKLLKTLRRLKDIGNTLIVVEHDTDTMLASDFIVDIGPNAGAHGGEVVFAGKVEDLINCEASITGQYLSGKKRIEIPRARRIASPDMLVVKGARENNLKGIDVSIPLGLMTSVTGVSGSGKSSLVNEIIYQRLARDLNRAKTRPGAH
ncbi:MAG: excinuclease ABC subunit UvrA, partial [Clostridiales bacterium]|nr:excinuclease ABC subunit UvrA [Clostridiales bacterium]